MYKSTPKVVFICGGKNSKRREQLEKYIQKHHPNKFLLFEAEDVWNFIRHDFSDSNALQLEEKLADYADAIIVLVESYGSVAELGAFSINKNLRQK